MDPGEQQRPGVASSWERILAQKRLKKSSLYCSPPRTAVRFSEMKRAGVVTVRPRTPADDEFILALARPSFGRYSQTPGRSVAGMMAGRSARTLVAESGGQLA